MKLKRFLLRYYPPGKRCRQNCHLRIYDTVVEGVGIILEYELKDKSKEMKEIDLLHLTAESDVDVIVNQIVFEEPLITESKKPHLRRMIYSKSND